jgi:hypothetical protein
MPYTEQQHISVIGLSCLFLYPYENKNKISAHGIF